MHFVLRDSPVIMAMAGHLFLYDVMTWKEAAYKTPKPAGCSSASALLLEMVTTTLVLGEEIARIIMTNASDNIQCQ